MVPGIGHTKVTHAPCQSTSTHHPRRWRLFSATSLEFLILDAPHIHSNDHDHSMLSETFRKRLELLFIILWDLMKPLSPGSCFNSMLLHTNFPNGCESQLVDSAKGEFYTKTRCTTTFIAGPTPRWLMSVRKLEIKKSKSRKNGSKNEALVAPAHQLITYSRVLIINHQLFYGFLSKINYLDRLFLE